MINFYRIALLIDADNIPCSKLDAVMKAVGAYGPITVKRAYGNWRKDTLKNWGNELMRLAIKAEQQFDYVPGKKAADIALVIDAIGLMQRGIYDAFVIVSSDSDFTPLAIHMRESGVYVIGVGEEKTPEAFRCSCDEFILIERPSGEKAIEEPKADDMTQVHSLLRKAADKLQNSDGYVNVCAAGSLIKKEDPDFLAKAYGYRSLPKLLEAFPDRYEIKRCPGNGATTIIMYKCIRKRDLKTAVHRETIIAYLTENGSATKSELAQLLSLKCTRTGEIIKGLIRENIITAEGNNKYRTYKLLEKFGH